MKYTFIYTLFVVLFNVLFAHPLEEINNEIFDAEESDFFEGDMDLNEEQMSFDLSPNARNGLKESKYRWPNNTIFYKYQSYFGKEQKKQIEKALREIEKHICIKFRPRTSIAKDYIYLTNSGNGCHSQVGRQGGAQLLNLKSNRIGEGCFKLGTIMHEFIHALGFYHQQSACNRDEYVTILWENIKDGKEFNFAKHSTTVITDFGVAYDYGSIMHYNKMSFSKNGKETVVPKDQSKKIGQRDFLSAKDIEKLRAMYECD